MLDLVRDYRICAYHHGPDHGTHMHHPLESSVRTPLDISTEADAERVVRAYAEEHDSFEPAAFLEVVTRWKSALKHT